MCTFSNWMCVLTNQNNAHYRCARWHFALLQHIKCIVYTPNTDLIPHLSVKMMINRQIHIIRYTFAGVHPSSSSHTGPVSAYTVKTKMPSWTGCTLFPFEFVFTLPFSLPYFTPYPAVFPPSLQILSSAMYSVVRVWICHMYGGMGASVLLVLCNSR